MSNLVNREKPMPSTVVASTFLTPTPTTPLSPPTPSTRKHAFELSSLPDIPLLRTLRYLGEQRFLGEQPLTTMRLTCRWVNQFIVSNKSHLIWQGLHRVNIEQKEEHKRTFDISVCRIPFACHFIDIPLIKDCMKTSADSTSFLAWFTDKFQYHRIKELTLSGFLFDEKLIENVDLDTVRNKLQVFSVELTNLPTGCDPNVISRMLTALRPQRLKIHDNSDVKHPPNHRQEIFTESFFKMVSTLDFFKILPYSRSLNVKRIEFPVQVSKIPHTFYTAQVFYMPLCTIVKAIRDWYAGDWTFGKWRVVVRTSECANEHQLFKAIGLPVEEDISVRVYQYESDDDFTPNAFLIYKNSGGHHLHVRCRPHDWGGDYIAWHIKDAATLCSEEPDDMERETWNQWDKWVKENPKEQLDEFENEDVDGVYEEDMDDEEYTWEN